MKDSEKIQNALHLRTPLIRNSDWSIADDFALMLIDCIRNQKPGYILELGSGYSTLIIAHTLRSLAMHKCNFITLEHDMRYLRALEAQIKEHKLEDVISLHHSPLVEYNASNRSTKWYTLPNNLDYNQIDMLIVDGPPGYIAPMSRYPALPLLWNYLSDNAIIILDDARRRDEQNVAKAWLKEFPDLKMKYTDTQKGTATFFKNPR